VTKADDITALRTVGGLSRFLGGLKGGVGLLVRSDFLQQQRILARGFFLGNDPAVMREHVKPADDSRNHREDEEDHQDRSVDDVGGFG